VTFHHEGTKSTGLLESVYELALCRELWLKGVGVERQVSVPVSYKGKSLDCHVKLDLLIDKSVVVEVKAVDKLTSIHTAQLLTYLRLQNLWRNLRVLRPFVVTHAPKRRRIHICG